MTSLYYRDLLRKHWLIVVICTLLCGLGALIGGIFLPASYQATATLQINIPEINAAAFYDSDKLIQTRMQLATSQPVLATVAHDYPGLSADRLARQVSTANTVNSLLFQITVRDADPNRAASLANDLANAVITYQDQVDQHDDLQSTQPLQQQLDDLRTKIAQEKAQLSALVAPQDAAQIATLRAQIDADQQQFAQVLATLAQVQQAQINKAVTMHIVQAAQSSDAPEKINYVLYAGIGLLVGLLLALFVVLVRDRADQRVRSAQHVSELVAWPIITEVTASALPLIGEQALLHDADAFQHALRSLAFLGIDQEIRAVAVVDAAGSARAGEIGAQLAAASARSGKKTLLIDVNLRHPSQAVRFQLEGVAGFSDALLALDNGLALDHMPAYIKQAQSDPYLFIMPAGSAVPNPTQVLQSKAMAQLVDAFTRSDFAFVVITGPALSFSYDARALAQYTSGIVPVIDLRHTGRDELRRADERLGHMGAAVLGCITLGGQV